MNLIFSFFIATALELPHYEEAGSSPLGRMEVVDAVLSTPLALPDWAETTKRRLKQAVFNHKIAPLEGEVFAAGGMNVSLMPKLRPHFLVSPPKAFVESLGEDLGQRIYSHFLVFKAVASNVKEILSPLTQEERRWLQENYEKFFLPDYREPFKFFEMASKIDLQRLAGEFKVLTEVVDLLLKENSLDEIQLNTPLRWEEEGFTFLLSSESRTTHTEEADFFIDLGSHNRVLTHAGGTDGTKSAQLHVAFNEGHSYEGTTFSQGSGFLGIGMLANRKGGHTFKALNFSQGCGFFGGGLLYNGEGENLLEIDSCGQSLALFGTSLLYAKGQNNRYLSKKGFAQAAAGTLGIAALVATEGNNTYLNDVEKAKGFGQGGSSGFRSASWDQNPSLYGGIAILYSMKGHNRFQTHRLGQGASYFLGLGALLTEGSGNTFLADKDSQGQGICLSAGALLNYGNNNVFESNDLSCDNSLGVLFSVGSQNRFKGTIQNLNIFLSKGKDNIYEYSRLRPHSFMVVQEPLNKSLELAFPGLAVSLNPIPLSTFKKPMPRLVRDGFKPLPQVPTSESKLPTPLLQGASL